VVLPRPELPVPAKAEPKIAPKPAQPAPGPVAPKPTAREKAAVAGLLPFADDLADLRDNRAVASLGNDRPLTGAVGDGPRVERSLITSKAGRGSGGINTAGFSRNTGGTGLGGRGTTQVTSTLGGGGGDGGGGADAEGSGAGGSPSRSREEIEMVFDQNKGAIYALYSRALRRDPRLQGKLVLQLTIEPSGTVSSCQVLSSELGDEELLQKLVQRVKMFRFLEKDVAAVTTTKPIDFFPA
jgi:TonB family protein